MKRILCIIFCCMLFLVGCSKEPESLPISFYVKAADTDRINEVSTVIMDYIDSARGTVFLTEQVLDEEQMFTVSELNVIFNGFDCMFPRTLSKVFTNEKNWKKNFTKVALVESPEYVLASDGRAVFEIVDSNQESLLGEIENINTANTPAKDCEIVSLYTDNIKSIKLPGLTLDSTTCNVGMLLTYWGIPNYCKYENSSLNICYKFNNGIIKFVIEDTTSSSILSDMIISKVVLERSF